MSFIKHDCEHRLINAKEVCRLTTLSRGAIYKLVNKGQFPAPIKIGGNRSGWIATEVDDWLAKCIEASRKAA